MSSMTGFYLEDLSEGMSMTFSKTITSADILMFAGVSGDTNPMHLDEEYASATQFKSRIAHGMLSASLISTVIGTKLPGPGAIYMSQNLQFRAPVRIGDTVTAIVTVKEINQGKARVSLDTCCQVKGKDVIRGDALVMVPRKPE